jgi:hypothetical protein
VVDRRVEEVVAQAAGVVEQLPDAHLRRDLLESGEVGADARIQVDAALLGEGEDQRGGERLADTRDGE